MFAVIIKNGRVIDGSGNPWFLGDVGICGDTIKAIGALDGERADSVIDATGLVVAPGFIDIHTHSDEPLLVDGLAHSHIRQGVTTNVIGNCGSSVAPITEVSRDHYSRMRTGEYANIAMDWTSMGDYLNELESRGVSVNVAALVGHGTVRCGAMGFADRAPTEAELSEMKNLVAGAMQDGAYGLSSGLIYVPGSYSETPELVELAKVAAKYGGSYNTHIRGENDTLLDAMAEAIEIGRKAAIPVQIAHLKAMGRHMWGKSVDSLKMVDDARADGIEVTCDQYPYNASATGLGAYMPAWMHAGGVCELMKRLKDPAARAKAKHDILHGTAGWVSLHKGVGWENTMITSCSKTEWEGLTISEIAKTRQKDDFETAFDILYECEAKVQVVFFTIGDEDIERTMRHPAVMVGSDSGALAIDGPLADGKPHPRSYGTFVRVLGHYARQQKTITLQEAVRKMTSMPAQKMRLWDRGLLRQGMKADVVVFDPDTVIDKATYKDPHQYPTGIEYVLVNGRLSIKQGSHLGTKAGTVLRHRHSTV